MAQLGTLRLFTFRPARAGFDALLRDTLLPDLLAFPALQDLHVGRQGPDDLGPRLVASVWSSRDAMTGAVGDAPRADGIIRVARGRVQPGGLELYRDIVLKGTCDDVRAGHGPAALYLASPSDDDCFVTLSVWASWAALEQATGGDAQHPIATRHMEQMVEWQVEHYEAVPNLPQPKAVVTV